MPVEDHPKFDEWNAALDKLTEAKKAQSVGDGSKLDVSMAQMELNKISDEIQDA